MTTRVINTKSGQPYDVYIGRNIPVKKSPYANPFKIGPHGSRDESIAKYREWLLAQPELVERARKELKGKVLGCWCKPEDRHGDVLVEIIGNHSRRRPSMKERKKDFPPIRFGTFGFLMAEAEIMPLEPFLEDMLGSAKVHQSLADMDMEPWTGVSGREDQDEYWKAEIRRVQKQPDVTVSKHGAVKISIEYCQGMVETVKEGMTEIDNQCPDKKK